MSSQENGQNSEIKLRDAKADIVLAENSGYEADAFIAPSVWTNDLRQFKDFNAMRMAGLNETEAGNLQRLKTLEEDREEKQQKLDKALDDAVESAQDYSKWLKEEHDFAGHRLTGREMEHVGK